MCGYEHEGPEPPEVCPVCGVGPEEFSEVLAPVAAQDPAPAGEARPVVIVGGGVAGFSAAEAARSASALAEIHLVCGEGVLPYNRVALTRLLAGQVNAELLLLKDEAWYAAQRITLHRVQAVEIDRVARAVILEGGLRLAYHKLVLATGATSFVPPILGAEGPAVYTLRTLQDAQAILAAASPGARGVVIGGGLLGLETAGGLAARGVRMTVVEGAPFLLSRQLTRGLAGLLERHIRDLGIEVLTDAKIQAIEREPLGVRLGGGRLLPADFVVISTGVRPDLALAQGLEQGRGLRVDDRMSTSDPSVLAAGDLVEHRGVVAGLWTVAQAQGAAAGRFAVDPAAPAFTPPPIATRLKVLDLPVFSGGDFAAEAEGSMALTTATGQTTARLVVSAGVLIGAVVIGDEALGGLAWRALQTGGPLAAQQPLLDAVPGLREWLATL
ncbi:MAG: FAD-dependent oxidoreductase [Deltaproteobacteria bacterium]|nr:FAD-dependent oxidoreductase [Deltaproteobacteria bacterium]